MNVEIKKLTPAHLEEYINFFETTSHDELMMIKLLTLMNLKIH